MSYPGNPALGSDVQQRIVATFEQTLDLAIAGNRQEALLGCDFVLRMDSHFEPARRLQERIKANPGPLSHETLADLMPAPQGPGDDDLGFLPHLDDLGDDLSGDLGGLHGAAAAPGGLRRELEQLFSERRFAELVQRAHQEHAALAADPTLAQLAMSAQEKLESAPYVTKFLAAARAALAAGQVDEVERHLAKARSLDPDNLELDEISRALRPGPSAGSALGDEASFFTLEPSAPSVAPAAPPAPAPAPVYASESDRRIAQLLGEGDAAFERGDPQAAIDSWSRIFLIDIDHEEAARRIERARRQKAESERQVEEIFHDGLSAGEAGDLAAARKAFERVLELQPTHLAAREQLQLLDSGAPPSPRPISLGDDVLEPLPSGFDGPPTADLKEEILVPPEGAAAQPRRERKEKVVATEAPAAAPPNKRKFMMIGAGVLVLVLAAGWLLFQNWERWFPNSESEAPVQASSADSIARAKKLQEQGNTAIAVAQLKRIPPSDPLYAKARELIKQWEAPAAPLEAAGPTPEQAALLEQTLAAAREAYTSRAYLLAAEKFKQGAEIAPLEATDAELFEDAKRQLVPIASQLQLFRDHQWDVLLPDLWRMHEATPGPDVDRLLIDSYYNLGIRELQRSNPKGAVESFLEAKKLVKDDPELERNLAFGETYQARDIDLLYRIYVKYLRLR